MNPLYNRSRSANNIHQLKSQQPAIVATPQLSQSHHQIKPMSSLLHSFPTSRICRFSSAPKLYSKKRESFWFGRDHQSNKKRKLFPKFFPKTVVVRAKTETTSRTSSSMVQQEQLQQNQKQESDIVHTTELENEMKSNSALVGTIIFTTKASPEQKNIKFLRSSSLQKCKMGPNYEEDEISIITGSSSFCQQNQEEEDEEAEDEDDAEDEEENEETNNEQQQESDGLGFRLSLIGFITSNPSSATVEESSTAEDHHHHHEDSPFVDELRSDLYSSTVDTLRSLIIDYIPQVEELFSWAVIDAFNDDSVETSSWGAHSLFDLKQLEITIIQKATDWLLRHPRNSEGATYDDEESLLNLLQKMINLIVFHCIQGQLAAYDACRMLIRATIVLGATTEDTSALFKERLCRVHLQGIVS